MSTMTGNLRRTMLFGVVGTLVALGAVRVVRADVASDKPGAILIFPKIVVDTSGVLGPPTDTEIQITNTSNSVIAARCFIVDDTSHCSNAPTTACTAQLAGNGAALGEGGCGAGLCGGACSPRVHENDFRITLTKRQPISWKASEGLSPLPCGSVGGVQVGGCTGGQSNGSSSIPNVQEDPFVGEIKCVEVSPDGFGLPTAGLDPTNNNAGDLKGEATIISTAGTAVDARKYNGIGIQSTGANNADGNLVIGGPAPEYNGCPKVVILDNFFDNATVSTHRGASSRTVTTDLTVVPCSEDFLNQTPTGATLQFLVFNEFEQRFSTSMSISCFKEVQLSDIDSRPGLFGNASSIFNVAVQGTISGQTRIRPVAGANSDNRVLAIGEQFWTCDSGPGGECSAASNTDIVPGGGVGDLMTIPLD
ncbi:MAG: hypothetical protein ACHQ9S_20300 [Candidatus Binatia bacterium]